MELFGFLLNKYINTFVCPKMPSNDRVATAKYECQLNPNIYCSSIVQTDTNRCTDDNY